MEGTVRTLPSDLLGYLQEINKNVTDIRDRVIRIESQDYMYLIRNLETEQETARRERQTLELKIVQIKTTLAPILVAIASAAGVVIDVVIRSISHN